MPRVTSEDSNFDRRVRSRGAGHQRLGGPVTCRAAFASHGNDEEGDVAALAFLSRLFLEFTDLRLCPRR
jgi:hypothetical protein